MPDALSPTSRRLVLALRVATTALVALHLAAPLFAEKMAWGLWPSTYLPTPLRWLIALMALVLIWEGERIFSAVSALTAFAARIRFTSPPVRLSLALGAGALFWLLRIRHLRWGDAELLVKALADPYRLTYVWQAPLDVFLHAKSWQLANALFGWPDPIPVYNILSTLAGVVFVWVLVGLAAILGRNRTERVIVASLVLTLGTMQLFFGYIENYPIMALGVLIYCSLALRHLRGELPLVWPAVALALTHAFHPSTIVLVPSLLWVAFGPRSRGTEDSDSPGSVLQMSRPRLTVRSALSVVVPYGLVFAGVVALMTVGRHGLDALMGVDFPGGGDRIWFVPLFEISTEWQHYTMFSLGHLVDIVNQQLLVAPVVWPSLVLVSFIAWPRLSVRDETWRFLMLMAGLYLLLTLVWNPDYGGQKDWDLFSPAAMPAALLLAWTLPRALRESRGLRAAAIALIATQTFHFVAWIWQNTLPQ